MTTGPGEGRLRVHGSSVSYYTGKLEAYLRYKELPYDFVPTRPDQLRGATGAAQVPALELPDGRWATDSTPIIAWLEEQHPRWPILPEDPLLGFVSWLIEDYADEWLWRPAMHYRWSFPADVDLLSRVLADELTPDLEAPDEVKRQMVRERQHGTFVAGDGVSEANRAHVEGSYLRALELLEVVFAHRPFVLGGRPTLADFGLMGPMLRHFSHDPTPAAIMVERAPGVWEWVARCWNARGSRLGDALLVHDPPADLGPLLVEIAETHLAYLSANAVAWLRGDQHFDVDIQGAAYRQVPASRYRVWCLEQLRARLATVPEGRAGALQALLEEHGCWKPLHEPEKLGSGYDPEARVPFDAGLEVLTEPEEQAKERP